MEVGLMEQNIEDAFQSMVDRKEFEEALDFIDSCKNKIPHSRTVNYIIFRVIMDKDCNKKNAIAAGIYLLKILAEYPPSDYNRRLYYKGALTSEKKLSLNLWDTFRHLVVSSFCHHKIFRVSKEDEDDNEIQPVQYPNCDILIDFFVKVLLESYEFLSSERAFYRKKEKSLVAVLFWPTSDRELSAAKENPRQFLGWIRNIYEHSARIEKVTVFKTLHQLFNLMVKCIIANADGNAVFNNPPDSLVSSRGCLLDNLPDSLVCSSGCLLDIVRNIMHNCSVAFDSHENVRRFMYHISLKYLSLKLCEYTLFELIYSRQPSERNPSPTTLKKIVDVYMFYKQQQNRRGRPKKEAVKETKEKTPKMLLKVNRKGELAVRSCTGDTVLHEACRLDKPADLYENLYSKQAPNVNAKNSFGQTPLHVACVSNKFLCAKVLIDECSAEHSKQKLDWTAVDEDGFTPLHSAIQANVCDIARMILKKGGSKAICVTDNHGRKPYEYASSKEMEKLLKEFTHLYPDSNTEDSSVNVIFSCNIPTLDNFKEYALFFHTLQFLLAYYSDIYHLYEISNLMKDSQKSSLIILSKHEDKACPHFIPWTENAVCSLDFEYLKQLPDILNHFIKSATEYSKEKQLNLDLELLPLKMYVTVLNS